MNYEVRRSTLGETNSGSCGSRNNSRYTGSTVCWEVVAVASDNGQDLTEIAVNTRRTAQAIVDWANEQNRDWNTDGDIEIGFINATGITNFRTV